MTELLAYPLNTASFGREYYDATDAQVYTCTRTTGVYSAEENLRVYLSGNRTISVSEGLAWLNFTKYSGVAVALITKKSGNISFDIVPSINMPRVDRVVISYNLNLDKVEVLLRAGIASANPTPQPLRRDGSFYEIALADIFVPVGSANLTQDNITDQRLNESLCGLMRDGVTGIPTQGLHDQFTAWFNKIKKELGEFEPAQILNEIDGLQTQINQSNANIDLLKSSSINLGDWERLPLNGGYYDGGGSRFGARYWVDATNTVHLVLEIWRDAPELPHITRLPYGIVPPFHMFFVGGVIGSNSKILFQINPYSRDLNDVGAIRGENWKNYEYIEAYTSYKTYRH